MHFACSEFGYAIIAPWCFWRSKNQNQFGVELSMFELCDVLRQIAMFGSEHSKLDKRIFDTTFTQHPISRNEDLKYTKTTVVAISYTYIKLDTLIVFIRKLPIICYLPTLFSDPTFLCGKRVQMKRFAPVNDWCQFTERLGVIITFAFYCSHYANNKCSVEFFRVIFFVSLFEIES